MMQACAMVLALGCMTCAANLKDGIFRKAAVAYRVSVPDERQWRPIRIQGNDLAWAARTSAHLLALNAVCDGDIAAPLTVLTRHLLMGFTNTVKLSQTLKMLDGREALHTVWTGKLNGVSVELELFVLKKNGCIHDFTYVSPVGSRATYQTAFHALLQGFEQQERDK